MNIMLWLLQRGFLLLAVQCLRNVWLQVLRRGKVTSEISDQRFNVLVLYFV
jgi:hypothetical protein